MDIKNYFAQLQAEWACSITKLPINDPIILIDGYTYDKLAISHWLTTSNKSPSTNLPLQTKQMVPNLAFKNLKYKIQEILPKIQKQFKILTNLIKEKQKQIDSLNQQLEELCATNESSKDEESNKNKKQINLRKLKEKNYQKQSKEINELKEQVQILQQKIMKLEQTEREENDKMCQLQISKISEQTRLNQIIQQLTNDHQELIQKSQFQIQEVQKRFQKSLREVSLQCAQQLLELGVIHFQNRNNSESIDYLTRCQAIYIAYERNHSEEYRHLLIQIGEVYQKQQDYSELLKVFKKRLNLIDSTKDRQTKKEKVFILEKLSTIHQKIGQFVTARQFYELSLSHYQSWKGKNSIECAHVLNNLGNILQKQGQIDEALRLFNLSIDIYQKYKKKESLQASQPYHNVSGLYFSINDYQEAFRAINQAIRIRQRLFGRNNEYTQKSIQLKQHFLSILRQRKQNELNNITLQKSN